RPTTSASASCAGSEGSDCLKVVALDRFCSQTGHRLHSSKLCRPRLPKRAVREAPVPRNRADTEELAVIHVIATIRLNPGPREKFRGEFRKLCPLVQAEDGCIEYGPTVDEPTTSPLQEFAGEDAVIVVEKWASVDALAAHSVTPHMADHRARVKALVRSVSL